MQRFRSLVRLVGLALSTVVGTAALSGRAAAQGQCTDTVSGTQLSPCNPTVAGFATQQVTVAETLFVVDTGFSSSGNVVCTPSGSVASCSANPSTYDESAGGVLPIVLTGTLSGTVGSGTMKLSFTGNYPVTSTAAVTVSPPVVVTPQNGNWYDSAQATITNEIFAVKNASSVSTTYNLTLTCTPTSGCTLPGGSTITVAPGATGNVSPSYSSGNLGQTIAISLVATSTTNSTYTSTGSLTEHAALDRVKGVIVHTLANHGNISTGADTTHFTVTNKSRFSTSVTLTPTCSGSAFTGTCTVVGGSPVTIGAGSTFNIPVASTGSSTTGATGYVKLVASLSTFPNGNDSAITDVQVTAQPAPGIVLQSQGANFDNADCLTVSIQPGVAYACGDLRVVHALPAAWTYNKKRLPVLIYRARTARPWVVTRGLVTLDPTKGTPDSVTAILVGTGMKGKYPGTDFANGATRHIALWTFMSHNLEPEILCGNCGAQTLQVNAYYGATNLAYSAVMPNPVDIRDTSRIGPGWAIAGLEHISIWPQTGGAPNWIWYGGDGSIRQYGACCGVNTPRWVAAVTLDRPDSMIRVVDSTHRVTIRRLAPHGVVVVFDSATGNHIATIDRLKHVTQFYYHAGAYMDLDSITAPAPGGRHLTWKFVYDSTGYLSSIAGPPVAGQSRTVTLTHAPTSHVLTQITDPDGTSETFTYSGYDRPSDPGVIVAYKNKVGTPTVFTYDSTYFLRTAVRDTGSGHIADTLQFTPAETRGLGVAGQVTASAPVDSVYTMVNGPRNNVTVSKFWLDGYGEPTRIRDPLGYETVVTRGDSRWPILVTRVRYANGQVTSATYDARGNIATHTDSSTFITVGGVTRYATDSAFWDQKWDFSLRQVSATGIVSWFELDASTGNRVGQMTHTTPDTTGDPRWIRFAYDTTTLLLSSTSTSKTQPTKVSYDTLGNLQGFTTSFGYWTTFFRDNIGRDTLIVATIDSGDFTQYPVSGDTFHHKFAFKHYDPVDRVFFSSDSASEMLLYEVCHGGQFHAQSLALDITTTYNHDGTIASIDRVSSPDAPGIGHQITQSHYDALSRKIVEIAPDGSKDSVALDKAGDALTHVTRMGYVLTTTYDALDRPTMKIIPATAAHDTSTDEFGWYPRYDDTNNGRGEMTSNAASGVISVPADTQTFTYDPVGNVRTAFNRDAHVSRMYNPNGTLATDTLRIRTYSGVDFLTHVYGLSYSYNLDKQRTAIHQPGTLAYVAGDSESFAYDNTNGNLYSATDVRGNWFEHLYDPIDRLTDLAYFEHGNNQSVSDETFSYDGDSRLLGHSDFMTLADQSDTGWTTNFLRADTITSKDARGKTLGMIMHFGQYTHAQALVTQYDGLGQLAAYQRFVLPGGNPFDLPSDWQNLEYNAADAFGNEGSVNTCTPNGNGQDRTYQPATGRITFQRWADNANGNGSVAHEWDNFNTEGDLEFQRRDGGFERGGTNSVENDESVNFFGADDKLHYVDRRNNYPVYADSNNVSQFTFYKVYFDEYRYDALGRRIMRRSRANSDCLEFNCYSTIQRFVYDGDELLWEISRPGWDTVSVANLEADTTQVQQDSRFYGRVLYLNGVTAERPLDVIRYGLGYPYNGPVGFHVWGPQVIVPHYNYQDQPDWISFEAGQQHTCLPNPNHGDCADYRLPNAVNAFLHNGTWPTASWLGLTLNGTTENQGSGLQYKRNRFYDPATGLFTQEDPIGLAGGLNAYGFGGGDPVSYRDPQGTCGPLCFVAISVVVGALIQGGFSYYAALHTPGASGATALNAFWNGALSGAVASLAFSTTLLGFEAALAPTAKVVVGPLAPGTAPEVIIPEAKVGYLFGEANAANAASAEIGAANVARSQQMLEVFTKIGVERADVVANLEQAASATTNVVGKSLGQYGTTVVKESFLMGKNGGIKLISYWLQNGGTLRLTSVIPYLGTP